MVVNNLLVKLLVIGVKVGNPFHTAPIADIAEQAANMDAEHIFGVLTVLQRFEIIKINTLIAVLQAGLIVFFIAGAILKQVVNLRGNGGNMRLYQFNNALMINHFL